VLAKGISNRGAHDLSGTRLPGINVSVSRINRNVRSGHGVSTATVRYWPKADIDRPFKQLILADTMTHLSVRAAMKRREIIALLGGAAVGLPLATRGQAGATRRVGALIAFAKDDPETEERLAAFQQGLAKRGWVEGRNIHIDYRFAAGRADPFPVFAKELVALQPDVILGHTPGAIVALQRETRTIPIVFVNVSDPIGLGFIASLSRPGGNITGVLHYEATIVGKWLAMLREIAPHLTRAVLLANPTVSSYQYFLRSAAATAPSLGIDLTDSPVQTAADIERAIEELARRPNNGLILPPDASTIVHRDLIVALAARYRLPAVYALKTFVVAGGLMSYGTDQNDMFRLAASYVDRILRGDKPADLPVQAPTRFETTVNLKTAKALGLDVPAHLLVAADEVIE
jgi:putative tryptophan/tyrosine transport system substrate-binding protein